MPIEEPISNSASAIENGSSSAASTCFATCLGAQPRVAVEVRQQDQELVAALAREQVGRAHDAAQAHRDPPQQLVAGRVAEAVVDGLEVVEVDVQQRDRMAAAPGAREAEREVLVEQRAVRQLRERVVVGEERDLLLRAAPLGDVAEGGHDAVGRSSPPRAATGARRPTPTAPCRSRRITCRIDVALRQAGAAARAATASPRMSTGVPSSWFISIPHSPAARSSSSSSVQPEDPRAPPRCS